MIELELFYEKMESEIRRRHTEYLKQQKRVPQERPLPEVDELPKGEEWKKLGAIERWSMKVRRKRQLRARRRAERKPVVTVDDKLLKGFSAGVECALAVCEEEYKAFQKRLQREERLADREEREMDVFNP